MLFIVVFFSVCCSSNNSNYEPSIWMVGDYYGTDGRQVPVIWKNGTMTKLSNIFDVNYGMANAIYVYGVDVYVAGANGAAYAIPVFWKNNIVTELKRKTGYDTSNSTANGIGVINGAVYVAGDVTYEPSNCPPETSTLQPVYWKDGEMNFLPVDNECWGGGTKSITIDGSDIYITGWMYTGADYIQPVYWKNGEVVKIPLPDDHDGGYATDLKVVGGKVYVSTTAEKKASNLKKPAIWYDNTLTVLVSEDRYDADLEGIAVSGSTIYSVGYYNFIFDSKFDSWPVLWTDKTWQKLSVVDETPLIRGVAKDIRIFNEVTYVAGWTGKLSDVDPQKLLAVPCYWRNGVRYDIPLPDEGGEVEAVPKKIFVQ